MRRHKMGLKISDAFRLSWSNISQHKKRSALIIFTISLLFSLVMGLGFIIAGIEKTVISASAGQTKENVYIEVKHNERNKNALSFNNADSIFNPEEVSKIDLKPKLNKTTDAKIRERASKYGGEVIGYYWCYKFGYGYCIVDKTVAENFINNDLWQKTPKGKIPMLAIKDWKLPNTKEYEDLRLRIGETLHQVGDIPSTKSGSPTLEGFNPINIVLTQLYGNHNDSFLLIDDGSDRVEQYVKDQLSKYLAERGAFYDIKTVKKHAVIKFSSPQKAVAFTSPESEFFGIKAYNSDSEYSSTDLIGTTLRVTSSFDGQRRWLLYLQIIILLIAIFIATMTFAHLIDQDAATVALYRAMGATTKNIYLIYFLYLVELCFLAAISTVIISLLFVSTLALTSAGSLALRLQDFYNLTYLPEVAMFKFNDIFWLIIITIIIIAPFSLLFTLRRFSSKHIAKKLKED